MMIDEARIEAAVREFLLAVGEDISREGLQATPSRVARMALELLAGMDTDPREALKAQFTEAGHEEMVVVRDISFSSMCEHHLLPFVGKAHIAYIPGQGRIVGLSKLARVVEGYSRRLQLQERLTKQIADALTEQLKPRGVLVVLEAEHMCMSVRGVKRPEARTVTSALRGIFKTDLRTREEALSLIRAP
ncbi:MAG: GTP cyclohydrolase I FolE [Coriobacteriales bacterium]|nr:GTP cyclohydrolase I FolE [Coriobacteriales bacterium]